jgi:hypothetical protein
MIYGCGAQAAFQLSANRLPGRARNFWTIGRARVIPWFSKVTPSRCDGPQAAYVVTGPGSLSARNRVGRGRLRQTRAYR